MSLVHIDTIREFIALARDTPPGCFVEVGVYQGGTAAHLDRLAVEQNRRLFLYDTFTGIPEKSAIDRHVVGDFGDTTVELARAAAPHAEIIIGVFPGTLIDMPPIAFAHIDCDQYASVKACCEVLGPRMVDGGVMWFDDYYCLDGATAAVNECFGERVRIARSEKAYVRF